MDENESRLDRIEKNLDRLESRHEALTQSVEHLALVSERHEKQWNRLFRGIAKLMLEMSKEDQTNP
jgi:hypothetical protein